MALSLAHNGTRIDRMAPKLGRHSRQDDNPRNIKYVSNRWRRRLDREVIAEGIFDAGDALVADLVPMLVAVVAALEPAWIREARAAYYRADAIDWAFEDWKWDRQCRAAELEFDAAMQRMDDDGAPVYRDHWAWD